jgi:hypothetical protein
MAEKNAPEVKPSLSDAATKALENVQAPRVLTGAEADAAIARAEKAAPRVPGAPVVMSADVAAQLAQLEAQRAALLKSAGFDPNGPTPKTEREAALDAIRKSPTLAERHPERFARRALIHPNADPVKPGKFDDTLDPNARR